MIYALTIIWALLVALIVPDTAPTALVILAPIAMLVLAGIGRLLARRFPGFDRALILFAALALTLRVTVPLGPDGDSAMLLAPLYLVILLASGVARTQKHVVVGSTVAALLLASLALSTNTQASLEALALFYFPFLILALCACDWLAQRYDLTRGAIGFLSVALVAALVGIYQQLFHVVWWNPKVIEANNFRADFRVNSIYWDPNMFGRVLVAALLILVATLLVRRTNAALLLKLGAAAVILLSALWFTYSQSSWIALAAGCMVLGVLTLPKLPRRVTVMVLFVGAIITAPMALNSLDGDDVESRSSIAKVGIEIGKERPITGWGVGTFSSVAQDHLRESGAAKNTLSASHTTPITLFAEMGAVGLGFYTIALLFAGARIITLWRGSTNHARPSPLVIFATACFVAIVAHSMLYAGFFEDPLTWVLFAILLHDNTSVR